MLRKVDGIFMTAITEPFQGAKIDPEVTKILRKMEKISQHDFYLTGSFSIKAEEPEDIDFFCRSSSSLRNHLISLGFKPEFRSYADSSFQEVLTFSSQDSYWSIGINQIHVQLIFPFLMDKKEEAQKQYELLAPFLSKDLSKDRLRSLWEILMGRS